MTIKTAKKFMKMSALLGFVVLGSLSFNAAAAVINLTTGDAEFGSGLAETSGDVVDADISVDVSTVAGISKNGASAIDSDVLGQVLDANIVNTSIVPLLAAA